MIPALVQADAAALPLGDRTAHCVVTSPPYWGLRDYGIKPTVWGGDAEHEHAWVDFVRPGQTGGTASAKVQIKGAENFQIVPQQQQQCSCGAWRGVLGLEPTPDLYVEHMMEVFREVWRVLRDDGTLWLNLGDSYAGSWGNQGRKDERGTQRPVNGPLTREVHDGRYPERPPWRAGAGRADGVVDDRARNGTGGVPGLKPKDMVGIPWRVAFALQADGWYLRSDIIWSKPNPMPESVTDRPTKAHEYLFLLAKAERYYYDAGAIQEEALNAGRVVRYDGTQKNCVAGDGVNDRRTLISSTVEVAASRNRRTVWEIATQPYAKAHFATFPEALVRPCILAGTSERGVCRRCGAPWERVERRVRTGGTQKMADGWDTGPGGHGTIHRSGRERGATGQPVLTSQTVGWAPSCWCRDQRGRTAPALVLDPFSGSGTVGRVCARLGRSFVGVEISPEYVELAKVRAGQGGLL
jgi:DNA modification methylase